MSRGDRSSIDILVLNYNGCGLLAECLPSVLAAAARSRHACRVGVVDNASTDGSVDFLRARYPQVAVHRQPNLGLCSYNRVLAEPGPPIAVLLNNDIKLRDDAIDPLVAPLLEHDSRDRCFMTAPLCWRFDGSTYEGMKTAVRWRLGLVQATALYPGHRRDIHRAGPTASSGAVMAVSRNRFLDIGGFDPLYFPGRIEDLDFALRGYLAGFEARYVPQSVAYHRGMATFGREFGHDGADALALRNTLLFQWKNLRHPLHQFYQALFLPVRLGRDVLGAPFVDSSARFSFTKALCAALARVVRRRAEIESLRAASRYAERRGIEFGSSREREFFRRFHPRAMSPEENGSTGGLHGALRHVFRHSLGRRLTRGTATGGSR